MFVDSVLTQVWSNQRHRVEVGELHVFGQVLGILPQQTRQLGWPTTWDVVLTLNEGSPKPRGTGTQQHAAGPYKVLKIGDKNNNKQLKFLKECFLFQELGVEEKNRLKPGRKKKCEQLVFLILQGFRQKKRLKKGKKS